MDSNKIDESGKIFIRCNNLEKMDNGVSFSMIVDKTPANNNKTEPIKIKNNNFEPESSSDEDFEDKVNRIVSETPPDPFMAIQSRTRLRWVDDANVDKCSLCNEAFRMFLRRHHCLIEGTLVTLSDFSTKKIENMKVGESVLSYNFSKNIIEPGIVDAVFDQGYEKCFRMELTNGKVLIATSDHRFLTHFNEQYEWTMVKDITLDHFLVSSDQSLIGIKVLEIYNNGIPQKVYDLSVPGNTSFVANGIISHNCRNCGNVFCGTCSNYWNTIPDCITHIPTSTGIKAEIDRDAPMRLCKPCNEKINLIKKLEVLLKSVQIVEMDIFAFKTIGNDDDLSDSFITKVNSIPDMKDMTEADVISFARNFMNGKLWKQLSNFYLSKFREIQYKLPYQEYSEWEKNALWTNYKYLKGHDVWMVHVIKAFLKDKEKLKTVVRYFFCNHNSDGNYDSNCVESNTDYVVMKDRDECWDRMCNRLCQQKLSWENALFLLDSIASLKWKIKNVLMSEIVKALNRCEDDKLENLFPVIIYRLINTPDETLLSFIISRCAISKRLANFTYLYLVTEKPNNVRTCDYLISRLFRGLSAENYETIMKVNNFVRTIEDNYSDNTIKNLDQIDVCVSPTQPELGEQKVSPKLIPNEISANRPIPILLSPNTEKENSILLKNEDLRTDLIIMSIIRLMKTIIEEALKIDLHVVTYNVQPTSLNTGYIQMVDKAQTLYKIEETLQSTLANYIRKHNPDIPTKELNERFSRSCAFYSVMTFLLGIGDRHLDNIMLTEKGELFHIDYGFVLGKDPRPMKSPYMRISEGMLDAIGGLHSEEYVKFKDLCYEIYDISRRHVNTFVILLSLLPKQNTGGTWTNPKVSDTRVLREVVKRFAPGETYEKAKSILDTRIDKSTNMTNRSKFHVVDFFHRHNKEGTIRNIVSNTVGYGLSGTTSLMSGIWDYVSSSII